VKAKIGDIAIEVMREENSQYIGYNEFGMIEEVFRRAIKRGIIKDIGQARGGKVLTPHPVNRQNVVLAALDRDKRFKKFYIRCCDRNGNAERLVREFELRTSTL
jgi:hypothetical protein